MEWLSHDVLGALRTLRARPGLTATLVLILGLGIGANCALFAVVNSLLLRPLPFEQVNQLVEVLQPPGVFEWEALNRAQTLSGAAAFVARGFAVSDPEGSRFAFGFRVSPNLFDVLGVKAALGRTFRAGEEAEPVVILGYEYWRRISGDPKIIGQTLTLSDEVRTVVGVLPAGFVLPVRDGNLFVPYRMTEGRAIARMRPGVTIEVAGGEVKSILSQAVQPARHSRPGRLGVEPLARAFRPNAETLILLQIAVGLVLLITCANAGNLLLVRANARRREFAIHAALGAGRWQLMRLLMIENLIIAIAGAAAGLLLATWSLSFVEKQLPGNLVRFLRGTDALSIDQNVLWFAIGLAGATVLLFGSAPAVAAMRVDVIPALRASGTATSERRRYMQLLVTVEIGLAVMLLAGAGLMGKSLLLLANRYLGFTPDQVLRTSFELPPSQYPDAGVRRQTIQALVERFQAVPGVTNVGIVGPQLYPFAGPRIRGTEFLVRGRSDPDPPLAETYYATPDYFRSLEIPLLRGRAFTASDQAAAAPVAILSESVAKRYWGATDPIGAVIRLNAADPSSPWTTVVGVVGDVMNPVGLDVQAHAYRPLTQTAVAGGTVMIRTKGDVSGVAENVRRELRKAFPRAPEPRVVPLADAVRDYISPQRFTTSVLGIFAFLGLALSAAGVYGVMRQWVSSRVSEIGVRMALGADPNAVLRLVLSQCALTVVLGLAIGVAAAFSLRHIMASQLIGVAPTDPAVLAAVVAAIAFTSLVAAFVPALWASRIDPLVALKYE